MLTVFTIRFRGIPYGNYGGEMVDGVEATTFVPRIVKQRTIVQTLHCIDDIDHPFQLCAEPF